jgi:hypothetical protein
MSFIISGNTFRSFAEYQDVVDRDQRLFEGNEGLTDIVVEDALIRASERLLVRIRATDWWKNYQFKRDASLKNDLRLVPPVNATKIIARKADFTDLCVYTALAEYLLPKVADFSNQDSAEVQKIKYYEDKSEKLFVELIEAGDWYDFGGDGTINTSDIAPSRLNLVRVR